MSDDLPTDASRHPLFRHLVTHPVAVAMMFIAAAVFGYVSYARLSVELMPDISYPTITVRTAYEGAAPEEVERELSRPIEEALATLDGLVTLESRSRAGSSEVLLGFRWGTDMSASVQSIRESLQTAFLPDQAERPLILRYDPSLDPFLRVALAMDPEEPAATGPAALYLLRDVAEEELRRELEGLEGVAAVRVRGGLEREIQVRVREDWLAARQVTLEQVQNTLAAENVNLAGGSVLEGDTEYLVRTLNEFRSLDEIRGLRVVRNDGTTIPITDVAHIDEAHKDRDVVARLDGAEAVEVEIFKEADANVVDVARRVKLKLFGDPEQQEQAKMLEAYGVTLAKPVKETLPAGVVLELLDDQAAFIEAAIDNLRDTAIFGGLLAIAVLFLFLRDYWATAIIGLAIPASVIIGFGPLYLADATLNLMSLGGLALGIGMLVDNAVVVLESIQRFKEQGLERVDAAVRGVGEVATAVTASTLTTVAVFLPIAFVEGVAGVLFGDLALAVTSSLVASLVVALVLVPTMAALGGAVENPSPEGAVAVETRRRVWMEAAQKAGLDVPMDQVLPARRAVADAALSEVMDGPKSDMADARAWLAAGGRVRRLLTPYFWLRFGAQLAYGLNGMVFRLGGALLVAAALRVGGFLSGPLRRLLDRAASLFQRAYGRVGRGFERALDWALRRPWRVVALSAVAFGFAVFGLRSVGTELIPEVHQGRFTVELTLPVGTPLERTVAVMAEAEDLTASHPLVRTVYATAGTDRQAEAGADEGEHTGRLRVMLADGGDLAEREDEVMADLRRVLATLPRVDAKVVRPALFSFRTPVEVVVYGWDLTDLRLAGERVADEIGRMEGVRDVRTSLQRGYPEVQIRYDRQRLQRFGLDPGTVARRVRDKVQGVQATEFRRGDQRVDLRVQLEEDERGSLEDLRRINVNPNLTPPIPLSAVADFSEVEGPSEIRRVDQQRAVVVSANVEGLDLGSVATDIARRLGSVDLFDEQSFVIAGQTQEMQESLGSLRFALMLAVFLVYVIMASTFENIVHPLVILITVPLAAVGVTAGLLVVGLPLSVVVFIGMIVLAGVVVNNAIVLVDAVNRLRGDGLEPTEALTEAARIRLRPILITATTTILGLLPLSLGFGAGAEVQRPLALTVIAGLASATVLTLVVIPVVYALATGRGRVQPPRAADEATP